MAEHPDDRLDFDAPFEPRQWAMHGLLSAYFERERGGYDARIGTMLERVFALDQGLRRQRGAFSPSSLRRYVTSSLRSGPSLPLRVLWGHRRWVLRGVGLAAAILLLAVYLTWSPARPPGVAPQRPALLPDFAAIAEAAVSQPLPMTGSIGDPLMLCGLDFGPTGEPGKPGSRTAAGDSLLVEMLASLNCGGLPDRLEAIETARRERDGYLEAMQDGVQRGEPDAADAYTSKLMFAWTRVYRPLRDLGHFDDALAEVRQAITFTSGDNPLCRPLTSWYAVCLTDLGETLEAMGDYEGARVSYVVSTQIRDALHAGDRGPHGESRLPWQDLCNVPVYLSLSWLAVLSGAREGLPEARQWQARAEGPLRELFVAICLANDLPLPPEATIVDCFWRMPADFQNPPEQDYSAEQQPYLLARYKGFLPSAGPVSWLRACLFNEARLRRVAGDYLAAASVLGQLSQIRAYTFIDEWHLDYYEPLERARLSILQSDYAAALGHLERARQSTGPRECPFEKEFNKRAVGPLALAEAEFLHGIALLGGNARSPNGRRLIEQSLAVAEKMADPLAGGARVAFLEPFARWENVLKCAAQ